MPPIQHQVQRDTHVARAIVPLIVLGSIIGIFTVGIAGHGTALILIAGLLAVALLFVTIWLFTTPRKPKPLLPRAVAEPTTTRIQPGAILSYVRSDPRERGSPLLAVAKLLSQIVVGILITVGIILLVLLGLCGSIILMSMK